MGAAEACYRIFEDRRRFLVVSFIEFVEICKLYIAFDFFIAGIPLTGLLATWSLISFTDSVYWF